MKQTDNAYAKLLKVLRTVENGPLHGLTANEVAAAASCDRSTAARMLAALAADERVEAKVSGAGTFYTPGRRAFIGVSLQQMRLKFADIVASAAAAEGLLRQILGTDGARMKDEG